MVDMIEIINKTLHERTEQNHASPREVSRDSGKNSEKVTIEIKFRRVTPCGKCNMRSALTI